MKKHSVFPLPAAVAALLLLIVFSARAAEGARQGLSVCAAALIPSLLPFFTLANLLSALGLPDLLGRTLGPFMARVFHISGCGAQAFFIGISGGYPLGASVVADLRRDGLVSRREAETLLAFCNNSGPAFILGAAAAVFRSPSAGILLYGTHVLSALCTGLLFRPKEPVSPGEKPPVPPSVSPAEAFSAAVTKAVSSTVAVCGYVTLFSALLGILTPYLALPPVPLALVTGLFELGSGISAFRGIPPGPVSLAAAAFILGWGGLSVHCQTLGVTAGTDIKCARHLAGRALCGVFAAVFTFLSALVLFQ